MDYSESVQAHSARKGEVAGVAHNIFLSVASQLGLVGLILYLGILFFVFKTAVPIAQRSGLGTGIFLGLIVAMIAGMTLPWENEKIVYVLFGSVLALQLHNSARRAPSVRQARGAPLIRVVHVVSDFAGGGGAETVAANLLRTADPEQFDARAISLRGPFGWEGLEETLAQDGIPVWYMGKKRGFDSSVVARIARTLEHFRPHVVHTHTYALRYALPYMLYRRVPAMVHTVHNLAEKEVEWYGRWVHRLAFRRGVLPVAIANEVADSIRRVYGIDEFPLIPNGIPVDTFRSPSIERERWRNKEGFVPTEILFVCVAWLRPQKNPVLLLESFRRGPASDPRAHLLLVGTGSLEVGAREADRRLGPARKSSPAGDTLGRSRDTECGGCFRAELRL